MGRQKEVMCTWCRRWLASIFNYHRHLKRIHGIDVQMRRQILLTYGEYKCHLHSQLVRFFRRRGLKQHYYYVHRNDDSQTLANQGINKAIISRLSCDLSGHPYEYRRNKKHMEGLALKGICSEEDVSEMKILNFIQEVELKERERANQLELVEDYRKTMQPMVEPDCDDLYTITRLRCSLSY